MSFFDKIFGPPNVEKLRRERSVSGLMKALKYQDLEIAKAAARALGEIKDEEAVPSLCDAVHEATLHDAAVMALIQMKQERVLTQLGSAVSDSLGRFLRNESNDWLLRVMVAEILGRIKDTVALASLKNVAFRPRDWGRVQDAVRSALESARWQPAGLEEEIQWAIARYRWDEVVAYGDKALRPLLIVLGTADRDRAMPAAKALGEIGHVDAVESLIDATRSDDLYVRHEALIALAKIGDHRIIHVAIRLLKDPLSTIRSDAAKTLGTFNVQQAVDPLMMALEDEQDEDVRAALVEALRKIDRDRAAKVIKEETGIQNPWNDIYGQAKKLMEFGLVVEMGTLDFRITDDGALYADGIFSRNRKCKTHPSPWQDLSAVSRGRTIKLNSNDLITLAAILLGREWTNEIVNGIDKTTSGKSICRTLFSLAGAFAHSIRHCPAESRFSIASPKDLPSEAASIYEEELKAASQGEPDDVLALIKKCNH